MSKVQIDDFECDCDNKLGLGELDNHSFIYTCLRCGKEYGGKLQNEKTNKTRK